MRWMRLLAGWAQSLFDLSLCWFHFILATQNGYSLAFTTLHALIFTSLRQAAKVLLVSLLMIESLAILSHRDDHVFYIAENAKAWSNHRQFSLLSGCHSVSAFFEALSLSRGLPSSVSAGDLVCYLTILPCVLSSLAVHLGYHSGPVSARLSD